MKRKLVNKARPQFGSVIGDILVKSVKDRSSMYRNLNGWAWDQETIRKAQKAGIKYCAVHEQDTSRLYVVYLEDFLENSVPIHFAGYGSQLVLPLKHWQIIENITYEALYQGEAPVSLRERNGQERHR